MFIQVGTSKLLHWWLVKISINKIIFVFVWKLYKLSLFLMYTVGSNFIYLIIYIVTWNKKTHLINSMTLSSAIITTFVLFMNTT